MKKKGKGKKGAAKKISIKTEDEQGQIQELQLKKKILQDQLSNILLFI